jgi:hypothetical protein
MHYGLARSIVLGEEPKMLLKIICVVALLTLAGCAALGEGYSARYGLTNTENPQATANPVDESFSGGTVGIHEIEDYEKKYRERNVLGPQEIDSPSDSTGQ